MTTTLTEVEYDPFASVELQRAVATTEAQREVWLADRLGREASLAYNESVRFVLRGALRREALQRALAALVQRHDALRSTIAHDGTLLQVALELPLALDEVDLTRHTAAARAEALAARLRHEVETPFDLAQGPMLRATLVALEPAVHLLLLTAHHIVCDGWSFGVIARELGELYSAAVEGRADALEAAPQFADHVAADPQASAADERYWLGEYATPAPPLDLPADRARPPLRGFASQREDVWLSAELIAQLKRIGGRHGASLFGTLLTGFAALLARLTGQRELVIGVPAAGQLALEQGGLVGHCVNLLPLRVALDPAEAASAAIPRLQGRLIEAFEHQRCTFGTLLRRLPLERDPSRLPLVSVMFNVDQALDGATLGYAGLEVEIDSNPRSYENFELFVNASQAGGALRLECQYNSALFDAATVRGWMAVYERLLQGIAAAPEAALGTLDALPPAQQQLLHAWNATECEFDGPSCVDALLARQAERTPHAVALRMRGEALHYLELETRATRLAHALRARGVGPASLVGLCVERSIAMVVAQIAVLKTGAAYVPLDPAYPAERLAYMAEDAELALLVAEARLESRLSWPRERTLLLDMDAASIDAQPDTPLPRIAQPEDPAYVIYTSGSTGKPKGVVVPHRAAVNLLQSMLREPGIGAGDRLVAVTTLSFDIALLELLGPLTVGAEVILASRDEVLDGHALQALLAASGATMLQATPSSWRLLIDAGWRGSPEFKGLIGGEALPADLAARLLERCGSVWNLYGPTETTVWSTCWRVTDPARGIRIGTPIANTVVQVLDAQRNPCPIGVAGEICIGGAGLAIGYLRRPELTAERFVEDRSGRLYRTGDRGRWCHDGRLEHLGRLDDQVKLRGHRIELGEIEAALAAHAGVARCVAIVREDTPGDARLVAYVVPRGAMPAAQELREHLRASLPEYMLPQHVVELQMIPLLPNGKVDRRSLPQPQAGDAVGGGARVAARTPLEQQVLEAFEQVLKLPGLGIEDDFFALGGHSLLAAQLTARLNKTFELSLPLSTVFAAPTAAGLAAAIEAAVRRPQARREPLLAQPDQSSGPLTPMQARIRFMEDLYPGRVVYNTPSAHRLKGPLDRAAFEQVLQRMVQRHPSLRTWIDASAAVPLQRVEPALQVELPFEDLGAVPAAQREAELMRRLEGLVNRPMDLHAAPLWRIALFRLADDEHVFLFMPHHIIWDGWSFDLLYQEMATDGALPAPPVSYLDYARWHARWLDSDECRGQVDYWRRRFARLPPLKALPTDGPRHAGMSGEGAIEWLHVDAPLTERLRAVARDADATLNMLALALYAAMMTQALASPTLVVGMPVRGRLAAEVEGVMGFFNNLLPACLELPAGLALADWVRAVKAELLALMAHEDVPFERLAEEPELALRAQQAGLYQTLFSFQDARERPRGWGALQQSSVLVMQRGATEDFGLWLMEVPGGLEGGVNYNADLFLPQTAAMFRDRYLALLQRVAEQPGATVEQLLEAPGADRDAMLAWVAARAAPAPSAAPVAMSPRVPLSAAERALAELWGELLGIPADEILPQDRFFDLGGNSLLVMRAVAEGERRLGLAIDPRRYVYEPLQRLALPGEAPAPAAAVAAPDPVAADAGGGWLSRVFGRRGRR